MSEHERPGIDCSAATGYEKAQGTAEGRADSARTTDRQSGEPHSYAAVEEPTRGRGEC